MNQGPNVLTEVVTALKQGLGDQLVAVLLFESRARGEADEASDWALFQALAGRWNGRRIVQGVVGDDDDSPAVSI